MEVQWKPRCDDSHVVMDDFVENEGAKLFQDSVHGTMQFEKLIVKVIDTIEFQRLRNIKQLSTAYLVYPAAAHNRFEHCLGVCFLAGTLLDHLERNSSLTWCKLLPDKEESRKLKLAVKVAALLHDIGHGPFSHTWEHFVSSSKKQFKHEISSEAILDSMIWKSTDNLTDANLTTLGKHFKEEFEDVLKYVKFIKHVISGNPIIPNKERSFLYQVVACKKNDVDVDKFDYFLRDAQHLNFGVPFDHKRLMMLSRIEIDSDGESHIAFRDVEEYSIELMFRVRADLHIRAYQHRVVKCLETMVIDALKEAEKAGYKVGGYALSDVHLDTRQFLKLTDSILECILNTEGKCYEAARKILTRVATRDLYTTIGEWTLDVKQSEEEKRDNVPPKGLSSTKLLELEDWLEQKCAVSQVAVNKGMYFNPMINVRFYSKDGEENVGGTRTKRTLTCLMELPYYKIYVFSRGNKESEFKEKRRKVEEFLVKEGVFITDK